MATSSQGWMDISAIAPRRSYTAEAGQTAFVVPFVFFADEDLQVYVADILQTLTTDYLVAGETDEAGGTVTFTDAMAGGESVVIVREIPLSLTTHLPPSGPLDIAAINVQATRLVAMMQQLSADWPRSLVQPDSDVTDFNALPTAANRASMYLFFDADGQPTVVESVSGTVAASAFMLTLLDDPDAATARATLGITDQSAYIGISNWHHCR